MRHSYFLTLPLFLLAAARPKRRSDDAQGVLLKAGTGVTLSNKDATLSLTPGQTTTLPFDGETYTSEVFWATASGSKTEIVSRLKAGGSVVQSLVQCTINIPSSKPGNPSVTITQSLPYVTVDWGSPAPKTATATCTDPRTGSAYLAVPAHATAFHLAPGKTGDAMSADASYTAPAGASTTAPLSLGTDKTTVASWSMRRTTTFTCDGGSTTAVPVPDILVGLTSWWRDKNVELTN